MSRHEARELAFQLLFQLNVRGGDPEKAIESYLAYLKNFSCPNEAGETGVEKLQLDDDEREMETLFKMPFSPHDLAFFKELVEGVSGEKDSLDEVLQLYLKDWRFVRLPRVDQTLLRMGAYEILHCPQVPKSVSISEIVLLARRYADEISKRYINGVLANFEKPVSEGVSEEVDESELRALQDTQADTESVDQTVSDTQTGD